MRTLEERLGYTFRDRKRLEGALYHSSYANEHRSLGIHSNERLEFLGDAVLGVVTADYLYKKHPDLPEGDLTRIRAALVCEQSLHEVAQKLNLGSYLKLGKGEEAGGGRQRASILADATESVFAAVYLDGGITAASELIHRVLLDVEREEVVEERRRDYKTLLQEHIQRKAGQELTYCMVREEGPDHAKTFVTEVRLNGTAIGEGSGHIFVEGLSGIKKRQDEPEDRQIGIEISDKLCRLPDERESRQSVIFDLYRDEQSVRRIKGVDGQKPKRRWAVNQHIVVFARNRGESLLQQIFPPHSSRKRQFRFCKADVGWKNIQSLFQRALRFGNGGASCENIENGSFQRLRLKTAGIAQIPLSVQIEQQYSFFCISGKLNTQIMRRRCLAYAAFLIGYCADIHACSPCKYVFILLHVYVIL